jgi:hypothetical protein
LESFLIFTERTQPIGGVPQTRQPYRRSIEQAMTLFVVGICFDDL